MSQTKIENKLFVIPITQKELVEKICFDSKFCGKIGFGCLVCEGVECFPCNETECKFEEKSLKYGKDNKGNVVYLRKIQEKSK